MWLVRNFRLQRRCHENIQHNQKITTDVTDGFPAARIHREDFLLTNFLCLPSFIGHMYRRTLRAHHSLFFIFRILPAFIIGFFSTFATNFFRWIDYLLCACSIRFWYYAAPFWWWAYTILYTVIHSIHNTNTTMIISRTIPSRRLLTSTHIHKQTHTHGYVCAYSPSGYSHVLVSGMIFTESSKIHIKHIRFVGSERIEREIALLFKRAFSFLIVVVPLKFFFYILVVCRDHQGFLMCVFCCWFFSAFTVHVRIHMHTHEYTNILLWKWFFFSPAVLQQRRMVREYKSRIRVCST